MSSSNLMRWSGLASVVGGVLLVVFDVAESVIMGGQPQSAVAGTGAWIIMEIALLVPLALIILGLVGLYVRQAEQTGTLGLIAFLVAFSGTMLVFGLQWSAAFMGSWLAGVAPDLLDAEPAGLLAAGFMISFLLLALGWLLFGLASLQARVFPRNAGVLLVIGAVLLFALLMLDAPGSSVLFGAALAWMGYALWSGVDEPALTAEATA